MSLLDIFGPYEDKHAFWNNLLKLQCFQEGRVILGGDLNLTLNTKDVWGSKARDDKLAKIFNFHFELVGLMDTMSISMVTT